MPIRRVPAPCNSRPTRVPWRSLPVLLGLAASVAAQPPRRPADAIRAARARSNAAIAAHDTAALAAEWMADVHVVTSTSAQLAGAAVNAARMADQFARRPDTRYVRTPTSIRVWEAWDVASERGTWTGSWTDPDGPVRIAGEYQAQWRRRDGRWRIQAEVFVPLSCRGGAYCRAHP